MQITKTNLLADREAIILQINQLQGQLKYVEQLIAYEAQEQASNESSEVVVINEAASGNE